MKTILVTGGAGYIGSIVVRRLLEKGYAVVIYDNFSRGNRNSLPQDVPFVEGDIGNEKLLSATFEKYPIDVVMHFAAFAYVGESVRNPALYFENNLLKSLILLETMRKCNVKKIIFSSSCATFGVPKKVPMAEEEKQAPVNPYGLTKYLFEKALEDYDIVYSVKHVILRYFNAAGAAYGIGECHNPETHLIPLTLQVALGQREFIEILGEDYPTKDGTCVRDYVHIVDIADAHISAINVLEKENSAAYNLGSEKGTSVKEIIKLCREVTHHPIPVKKGERREGDPPSLVASSGKIKRELGWEPKYGIKEIIESAWEWHKKNPSVFA